VGLGLLYLGYLRVFKWDQNQQWLPYLGRVRLSWSDQAACGMSPLR
jgi:hypothetical protein